MIINAENIPAHAIYSRIVSLVPSQTELLYDLALEEEVVGITKFCLHPDKWYKTKHRIGGTKNINLQTIKQLQPDLIIANKEENVKEQVEELAKCFDVLVTDVNNLQGALTMINDIGKITGKSKEANSLASKIETEFAALLQANATEKKIKTAYLIWKNPYMVAGGHTFINNMMQYCGMINLFANVDRYPKITEDDLKDCELILLSSEPYSFKENDTKEINAKIPTARTLLVDGEMFSWYGSRLLKSVTYFENLRKKLATQY